MPQWKAYFNDPNSSRLGLISGSLFLPAVITPYISSWINGRWGRKVALATGSLILITGAFINAFAKDEGVFILGRVFMGAAGPFGKITAIALLQEIAHPRLRSILATSFYCNYYFGSIAAAWFCYGSLHWGDTNWAWRAPCLFQIMAPSVVLLFLPFIPESPRWLVHHEYHDKALEVLAKYHANGDREDELVRYEYEEICQVIRLEEENKKTSFMDFIKTPGNRRRLLVLFAMGSGTNWVGNGIITYYLTPVLNLIGITNYTQISGINGGIAIWNLIMSYVSSLNAERVGRRKLWLASTIGMLISYIVMTGLSGSFAHHKVHSVGVAVIPWLFIYYGAYDIGWTPLPFSYAAEILPYHMRLKGLGIMLSVQSIFQAFNQFVNPIALAHIQWKYYIVYIALLVMYLVLVWFYFPETKGLTVEEVSVIFDKGRLADASAAKSEFTHKKDFDDGTEEKIEGKTLSTHVEAA